MAREPAAAQPIGHLRLRFRDEASSKIPTSLSAVEQVGNALWLAGDETASLERLTTEDYSNYDSHQSFVLADFFDLPGGRDQEADLEGLAFDPDNSRLWFVGSHSLRRGQPKDGESDEEAFAALKHVDSQENRYVLGSIDLRQGPEKSGEPEAGRARALPFDSGKRGVVDLVKGSSRLGPFLKIPSKDNGFDIEGLAARGGKVFVGLRGPVLRGWATILQLDLEAASKGLWLARPPGGSGKDYLHHVLDLDGLGVRDLCISGDDLLILAGPTMALDGPMRVLRWRDALKVEKNSLVEAHRLQPLVELTAGNGSDHAEGIALFQTPGRNPCLLVVYDSPATSRLHRGRYFEADLFAI